MPKTPIGLITTLLCIGAAEPAENNQGVADVRLRLEKAYGGKSLRRLRTIRIRSDRRLAWMGQGQTSAFVEFATDRQHKYFDLRRRLGSVERWIHQTGNVYHNRYIVDREGAATIDYASMTYSRDAKGTYFGSFAGDYRISDLLLAHHVVTSPHGIEDSGAQFYDGRMHDVLKLKVAPNTPQLEVFVARDDGLIRRIRMKRAFGMVNIVFASHGKSGDLRYARESRAFLANALVEYEHRLSVSVNVPVARHLKVESTLRPAATPVDTSEMTVETLAPGIFHVGREDYSLFVQTDDGYIAVSTYAGLKARYEALVAHTQDNGPLSHVILTHHHENHMAGVADAVALGATLHVTKETERALSASKATKPPSVRVLSDETSVGPLKVFVRPTAHAIENAFVYHPGAHILFQDDHYHGLLEDGPTWAQPTAVSLHAIIKNLGIKVDKLLSGHARKAEQWDDFVVAIKRTRPRNLCPSRRRICRDK